MAAPSTPAVTPAPGGGPTRILGVPLLQELLPAVGEDASFPTLSDALAAYRDAHVISP